MSEQTQKKSFFISYTGADIERAKWVTKTLEDNGYTAIIQARDFLVGTHFPQNMDEALKNTEAVLTIVSARYLSSDYCRSEWLTAYRQDRTGGRRYIIPVRVEEVVPEGMLARNIYIDIFGDMDEDERKKKLLLGMKERLQKLKEGEESDEEQTENFWKNEKTVKSLPYCRNGYFTGREKTLADLQKALIDNEKHPIQVIAGLGGVGKTEIALEFCYRNLSRFHTVWWMPAEDTIGLDTAYKKLGDAKGILSGNEKDADEIRETVRSWLENNPGYLLIYDNVENTKAVSPYLPREIPGSIIITSRDVKIAAGLEQEHQTVNIDVFDAPDAALFLVKRARKADSAEAEELAQRLGLLSLALEHAAAYILANNIGFADYLALLEKSGLEVFNANEDKNKRYMRTVNSTWRISIAKIKNQSAEQMLYLCAYLASEGIIENFFKSKYIPSPLKDDIQNTLKKNAVFRELTRYSLITEQVTPEDDPFDFKYYSIHRLMQETIRNGLEGDTQYIEALFNLFGRLVIYKHGSPNAREMFDLFLPHSSAVADQIVESFKFDSFKLDIAVRIYNMIAIGLEETGRLRESKDYYRKIKTVQSLNLSGEEDEHTAIIYNNSSDVYMSLGLYKEAFDYAKKALAIFKKINGKEHFHTAGAYNTLAVVCGKMGNTKDAQKYLETAQKIFAKQKDEDNPNTAIVYNNMANNALQEGDYAKALDLSEKALAIRLKVLGQGHPLTGASYQGIAVTCMLLDQDDRAREHYNKALAVFRVTLGLEHPNTGTVFQSLGDLSLKQNDEEQAREWYAKALKIFDKVFGREHPATETLLERIDDVGGMESLPPPESFDPNAEKKLSEEADEHFDAAIDLEDEGDEEGAIEEYTKCLELRPNEYDAYVYRAALYEKQGKPDLAIADYSEALKIYRDKWEPWVYRGQLYAEALKNDESALADLREAAELNPQEAPKVIYNVALHCYRAEDYERAILYFSEYINLTFQSDALDAYYLRALCYFQKGNTERAIADLKKAADLGSEKAIAKLKEMKNGE